MIIRKSAKILSVILIALLTITFSLKGQVTSSPYSVFGLGFLEGNSIGPSKAMGGAGIALLSNRSINLLNPASYSGIDSLISIFEIGFFGKYTAFSSSTEKESLVNANFKYAVMGFRITPWLATSFGFTPYSSVGYKINTTGTIEGTTHLYSKIYEGEGGVNQVYYGNSFKLIKNLSVGYNLAYLFGNITNTESSPSFEYSLSDVTYLSNLNINWGLNYGFAVKETGFRVGLTYSAAKDLRTDNETTISTPYGDEVIKSTAKKYSIPQTFGAGLAFGRSYFTAGFDYERSTWKNVTFTNPLLRTRNSNRYSAGIEFPSQGLNKGTNRMILYRLGAEYRESYMIIDENPINSATFTFGAGLPLNGILSVVNISLELGQNGTINRDLFRERFAILHIDLSLRDLWFRQRRYN